jgi:hypothetical protein
MREKEMLCDNDYYFQQRIKDKAKREKSETGIRTFPYII